MLELRHLNHLVALADERHFARAADRVHLSQPAFSRSIQALERRLGQRLFDRDGGEVRPTPAGAFLIERARQLLFDARNLHRDAAGYADSQLGDSAFGVGPFPAATLMPQVLASLRRAHPRVALRVAVGSWALLLEHLRAETIEFFVADVRDLPPDPLLAIQPLGLQPGGFYVRAGHPLPAQPCTVAEFWPYGVASTRLPPVVLGALAARLGPAAGQAPALALECDDVALLRQVALATDTVLGATEVAVQADLAAGRLRRLAVSDLPSLHSAMGVVRLRKRTPSPMARRAIDCIAQVALTVNLPPAPDTGAAPAPAPGAGPGPVPEPGPAAR